ncbi:septum formation protein Maf [bacterium]|nr:septum formation protein Maf [bacterium]
MRVKLVLASGSPRRIELLNKLGIAFEVVPSNIEEPEPLPGEDPVSFAKSVATLKADKVSQNVIEGFILGTDTIVEISGLILGKPTGRDSARDMLRLLSGRIHRVITGFTIIDSRRKRLISDSAITVVKFRRLKEEDIEDYLDKGEYMDKAGAYAIQGYGSNFIEYIRGCYYNVMGLPIERIIGALKHLLLEEEI